VAYSADTSSPNAEAFAPDIHVNVAWYWITLPLLLPTFAFTTFLGMVCKNCRFGGTVWRNSVLPLVLMSVEAESKAVHALVDDNALKKRSEALRGVVQTMGGELKFMSGLTELDLVVISRWHFVI
jgi:hypothetical protein